MKKTIYNEFSLEGVCYSGKTTLARSLCESYRGLFLPEYSFFDRSIKRRKKFPPMSKKDSYQSFEFFLDLDKVRKNYLVAQPKKLVFSDRSIISTIAFEYAKFKVNIPNVLDQVTGLIDSHIQNIILPTGWIYMRFNNLVDQKTRLKSHHVGLSFLVEDITLKNLQYFYDRLFVELKQFSLVIPTEYSQDLQLKLASRFIEERLTVKTRLSPSIFLLAINNFIKNI